MKLLNFVSPSADSSSKIGCHFSNKVVLKLKSAKNAFYKKGAHKLQIARKGPVKDCSWQRYINSFRIKRQIFL